MNKPRMFVRTLTAAERQALEQGRRSADAFTPRRSQVLLASADGLGPAEIGRVVGCTAQAARNAIRAFHADGLGCLAAKSHARQDPGRVWDRERDEDLKDLLHRRPRAFGKPTSPWTLGLVAEVCRDQGWTPRVRSVEAIRHALRRLGVGWQRAEHWITSPDPAYARKKSRGTGGSPRRPGIRAGCWGSRTRRGGPGWPNPGCSPGLRTTHSACSGMPGTRRGAGRRPARATGDSGPTRGGGCCGSVTGGP